MPDNDLKHNSHSLILHDRSKLSLSGVADVVSYNDKEILTTTAQGTLKISGSELHIERLSVDEGDLLVEGNIDSLVYTKASASQGGLIRRLFN